MLSLSFILFIHKPPIAPRSTHLEISGLATETLCLIHSTCFYTRFLSSHGHCGLVSFMYIYAFDKHFYPKQLNSRYSTGLHSLGISNDHCQHHALYELKECSTTNWHKRDHTSKLNRPINKAEQARKIIWTRQIAGPRNYTLNTKLGAWQGNQNKRDIIQPGNKDSTVRIPSQITTNQPTEVTEP